MSELTLALHHNRIALLHLHYVRFMWTCDELGIVSLDPRGLRNHKALKKHYMQHSRFYSPDIVMF